MYKENNRLADLGIHLDSDYTTKNYVQPITDYNKINAMAQLLKSNKNQGYRNYILFIIGINTGLRISDLLTMQVGQFREICKRGYIILIPQKTDKRRLDQETGAIVGSYKKVRIDITDSLKRAIEDYIQDRDDREYMFPSRKGGTPISRQAAWNILDKAAKQVGITENIGCHSLRKTFGYWHYQQNHDVRLLMDIFQHSSEAVTLKYIGVTDENMKKSMANMSLGL